MSVLHVIVRVGDAEYALAASDVVQMESFAGATPVPGARPYVAGLVQIRGKVVPVIDARVRCGLPSGERTLDTRVVVSRVKDRTVGLVVDAAREVIKLAPEQLQPPPPLVAAQARGFVKAVAQVGPRMVMLVDLDKVVGEEQLDGK